MIRLGNDIVNPGFDSVAGSDAESQGFERQERRLIDVQAAWAGVTTASQSGAHCRVQLDVLEVLLGLYALQSGEEVRHGSGVEGGKSNWEDLGAALGAKGGSRWRCDDGSGVVDVVAHKDSTYSGFVIVNQLQACEQAGSHSGMRAADSQSLCAPGAHPSTVHGT